MPFKPKAGEIYLFKAKSQKEMNNWRAIGHRFYQARGGKWICGDPHIRQDGVTD